jgi:hypothetical protein
MSNQPQLSARKRVLPMLKHVTIVLILLAMLAISAAFSSCGTPNGVQAQCNGIDVHCNISN